MQYSVREPQIKQPVSTTKTNPLTIKKKTITYLFITTATSENTAH